MPGSTRRTGLGARLTLRYRSGRPCRNRAPAGGAPRGVPPPLGARPSAPLRATAGFKCEINKSQIAAPGGRVTVKMKSPKPARSYRSSRVCLTKTVRVEQSIYPAAI